MPSSSIGAGSSELSRFILNSDDLINDIILYMQGFALIAADNGELVLQKLQAQDNFIIYKPMAVTWMRKKLQEVLNKNFYLSQLTEIEMYKEAGIISENFKEEAFINMDDLFTEKVETKQYNGLCNTFDNFLSQSIRRALNESDKTFLGKTTSESTQKLQQFNSSDQNKGLFGFLKK